MSRIQKLDSQTANMIAAGEVVERPRGVVKELIENAVDAGSTRIIITIEDGGLKKIVVEDNGCGMDREDAQAAFERHATSKIRSESDLWNIHTMGFRGEALPSIASVAKTTLTTSDGEDSTRVVIAYGEMKSAEPVPCSPGTSVMVEGLFYETPARLKHMRSAAYEGGLIQSLVSSFALCYPEIAFRLFSQGKEVFRSSGSGDLAEVLYNVCGRTAAENAVAADFEDFDYHVHGYLVKPVIHRASRSAIHLYLNRRMVRERRLIKAVEEGYRGFLPEGREPIAVLSVDMDPHILDVNVHPSKWEVRLSKENQLEYLLSDRIHALLAENMSAPEPEAEPMETAWYQPMSFSAEDLRPPVREEKRVYDKPSEDRSVSEDKEDIPPVPKEDLVREEEEEPVPFLVMHAAGIYKKSWLLAETETGLAVLRILRIEQRLQYEALLKAMQEDTRTQPRLLPLTIHTSHTQRIDELNAAVSDTGIVYEPFGKDAILVREVPLWLKAYDIDEDQFLTDLAERYLEKDEKGRPHETIALTAVHHMRFKGSVNSIEEGDALIRALSACDNPWTSPDGKPVFVLLDEKTFLKELR